MGVLKKSNKRKKIKTKIKSKSSTAEAASVSISRVPRAGVPDPVLAPDGGDYFRAVLLDHLEPCREEDCRQDTRLANRDPRRPARHPAALRALAREELAGAAGVSATSSGFANNLGALRSRGILSYPDAGSVKAAEWLFV